jgi:hypothetical protein
MEPSHDCHAVRAHHCFHGRLAESGRVAVSDFVLEISGAGSAITLEPVGLIDGEGARTLLDAVGTLRGDQRALLEIRTDRITGLTGDAWRVLAASELPVEAIALPAY